MAYCYEDDSEVGEVDIKAKRDDESIDIHSDYPFTHHAFENEKPITEKDKLFSREGPGFGYNTK